MLTFSPSRNITFFKVLSVHVINYFNNFISVCRIAFASLSLLKVIFLASPIMHIEVEFASNLSSGLASTKVVIIPESCQPVPVILPISDLPLLITKYLDESVLPPELSLSPLSVHNLLGPTPTVSNKSAWPSYKAFLPALNMLSIVHELSVHILIFNLLQIAVNLSHWTHQP